MRHQRPKVDGQRKEPSHGPHTEKRELLLDGSELVVSIKRIIRPREGGRLSLEEVGEVIVMSSPTSYVRGCIVHESFKEHSLSLTVLFYFH